MAGPTRPGPHHARRISPTAEINAEYAARVADFVLVEQADIATLASQDTGTATVSATLTAAYAAGSVQMQVDDASVFGPDGIFTTPVTATASVGGVPVGTFALTGRSGNLLARARPSPEARNRPRVRP